MSRIKAKVKKSPNKAISQLKKIVKEMEMASKVKVGLPKGSNNYPDGTSVIMVGNVHEFGSPASNVPERSFLRSTLNDNRSEYRTLIRNLGAKIATGEITTKEALSLLGLKVSSDVKDKITDIKDPPLKSREGNPLIDTGHLRQSITYEVSE